MYVWLQDDICDLFPSIRSAPVLQVRWLSLGKYSYPYANMSVHLSSSVTLYVCMYVYMYIVKISAIVMEMVGLWWQEWAGLRPGRSPLRLDSEQIEVSRIVFFLPCALAYVNVCAYQCRGGPRLLVHCYGHGGSGITLAMGCAG